MRIYRNKLESFFPQFHGCSLRVFFLTVRYFIFRGMFAALCALLCLLQKAVDDSVHSFSVCIFPCLTLRLFLLSQLRICPGFVGH